MALSRSSVVLPAGYSFRTSVWAKARNAGSDTGQ